MLWSPGFITFFIRKEVSLNVTDNKLALSQFPLSIVFLAYRSLKNGPVHL